MATSWKDSIELMYCCLKSNGQPKSMFKSHSVLIVLSVAVLSGCGSDLVPVKGQLLMNGEASSAGTLNLAPIGEGKRAYAAVQSDGSFELFSEGSPGAMPGSYRVTFQQQLNQSSDAAKRIAKAKELNLNEVNVVYEQSRQSPSIIPESGTEELQIDISEKTGWRRFYTE